MWKGIQISTRSSRRPVQILRILRDIHRCQTRDVMNPIIPTAGQVSSSHLWLGLERGCRSLRHHNILSGDPAPDATTSTTHIVTIVHFAQRQYCTSYRMIYLIYEVNCHFLSVLLHKYLIFSFFTS